MLRFYCPWVTGAALLLPCLSQAQETDGIQQTLRFGTSIAIFDEDDGNESGRQIVAPIQYTYSTPLWDFGVKAALIDSEHDSNFVGNSGSVTTLSDIALSGTYRAYAGNLPWLGNRRTTFAFNADINLTTGKAQLTGDEKNAVFDSFLVEQDRFGEGLNIALGVSSTVTLSQNTLLGAALSYNHRGTYAPDGDAPSSDLDPGDQIVGALNVLQTNTNYQLNFGHRAIIEGRTKLNGVDFYDRAPSHELFFSGAYLLNDDWTLRGSALFATRGADSLFNAATGQLEKAEQDDNGDSYYLSIGASRALSNKDQIGIDVSYRRLAENDFDEDDFAFAPSLTRREIALSYARQVSDTLTFDGSIGLFDVEEGDIAGFAGPRYSGVQLSAGVKYAF